MKRDKHQEEESARRITRRAAVLGLVQAGLIGGLALRMRNLQLAQGDEFRLLAEENRINVGLIPPARGLVFDRNGAALSRNLKSYRVVLVREQTDDMRAVLSKLSLLIPLSAERREKVIEDARRTTPFVPVTVAERLSWEDVARVSVNAPSLPGIAVERGDLRQYPFGGDFAHVVGYVGRISEEEIAQDSDPLLQIPDFHIGKTGIEVKLEKELRGSAGFRRIEVNAAGRVMREIERSEGVDGGSVQITMDASLQNFVQARLDGLSAAAVAIDVSNGDILALGSMPSFDPNRFVTGISHQAYEALTSDMFRPLAGKTVQGAYPPGSTFKMVTALAALESGEVPAEETVKCEGFYDLPDRRFHCWREHGHGDMDMIAGIEESCDVYIYQIARRVGIERISKMARRLGLGEEFRLPLSAMSSGLVPNREWKLMARKERWVVGDTLNAGIGQGLVLASPLQLVIMAARLATGRKVSPRLVRAVNGVADPAPSFESLGLPEEHLRIIRRGMLDACNSKRGTAFASRIAEPSMIMAGKTGTSQVRIISEEEREEGVLSNDELPWEERDHALFVGYAPYDAPRYAVSAVVEHGGSGSSVAAPVVRDIMLRLLYGGIPPLSAYPPGQRRLAAERLGALDLRPIHRKTEGVDKA